MDVTSQVTAVTVAILFGVVFTVSGLSKLRDLQAFQRALQALQLVEPRMARPAALVVALAELAVPVLLVLARSVGLVLAIVLLAALTIVVIRTVRRGVNAPCGCFGQSSRPITLIHAWRNLALLVVGAAAWAASPAVINADPAILLTASGLGLLLALVTLTVDDWVELLQPSASSQR